MPRKSRIEAPGALHHVIGRGIARQKIFLTKEDRDDFLERLGSILIWSKAACYAWALMANHFPPIPFGIGEERTLYRQSR